MSEQVWGWAIVGYLWLAGIAGGTYMAGYLFHVWDGLRHRALLRLATYISTPLFALAALLLTIDLGRTERFWHLFVSFRPSSVMWLGSYLFLVGALIWAVLLTWEIGQQLKGRMSGAKNLEQVITALGFFFALMVVTYIGVLFTQTARPLWDRSVFLPALFLASAFSTGIAALLIALRLLPIDEPPSLTAKLHRALVLFITLDLGLLAVEVGWLALFQPAIAAVILAGTLSPLFWAGLVILGLIVPLVLELRALRAGVVPRGVLVAPILVILGGLAMRYIVTIGGQL